MTKRLFSLDFDVGDSPLISTSVFIYSLLLSNAAYIGLYVARKVALCHKVRRN